MIKKYALGLFVLIAFTPAAHAQNGMYYTARSPALKEQGSELRSLSYAKPDATPIENPKVTATGKPATEEQAAETPSDKAWEKYKALATGTAKPEAAPQAPAPQQAQAAPEKSGTPVGLAGIIQEYQKTKASRSEMRTLVITKPDDAKKIEEEVAEKKTEEKTAPTAPAP